MNYFQKVNFKQEFSKTASYEGFLFNCETFILDLAGSEYMDSLVKNYVKKIATAQKFIESITNFKINSYDKDFFFKKYNKAGLNELIEK